MLIAVALVASVSLTAVLYAAGRVVESYSLQRSADDLVAAKAAFDRLVESRARFAAAQTRLIAELPVFRAHMDPSSIIAGDAATISAMAEDYRRKLAADFCLVTDARGRLDRRSTRGREAWPRCRSPRRSAWRAAGDRRTTSSRSNRACT